MAAAGDGGRGELTGRLIDSPSLGASPWQPPLTIQIHTLPLLGAGPQQHHHGPAWRRTAPRLNSEGSSMNLSFVRPPAMAVVSNPKP
nr:unnamed protein product [Digitaria exilis]